MLIPLYAQINRGNWLSGLITLGLIDCALSLTCWQCIADNCEQSPATNYKATRKECRNGQECQKVYFEMFSTTDNRRYFSTVRGCAWDCIAKNDHENCSRELYTTRGCIQRLCCSDQDLCNQSQRLSTMKIHHISGFIVLVIFKAFLSHLDFFL